MGIQAASSLLVDFDIGREIVLVCTSDLANEVRDLAQDLLASGFEVNVVSGLERGDAEAIATIVAIKQPGLIVVCHRGSVDDLEALQKRAEAVSDVPHGWLHGHIQGRVAELHGAISAKLGEIERAEEQLVLDAFDVEELSNVVLLPTPEPTGAEVAAPLPPVVAPPLVAASLKVPQRRWRDRLLGAAAGVAVASFAAIGLRGSAPTSFQQQAGRAHRPVASPPSGDVEAEPASGELAEASPPPPVAPATVAPTAVVPATVAPPSPPSEAPETPIAAPPEHSAQPEPMHASSALDSAIHHKQILRRRGLLVTDSQVGNRSWFQAMTYCRAHAFGDTRGWRVPTRGELARLARSGALPEHSLWSSNRGDRLGHTAYTVHGRAGVSEKVPKDTTTTTTVCVHADIAPESPSE